MALALEQIVNLGVEIRTSQRPVTRERQCSGEWPDLFGVETPHAAIIARWVKLRAFHAPDSLHRARKP